MEWTKSNISRAELEQKQQAYIKEALEMAKRSSAKAQDDEALREKEKKKAAEKAEAERKAAEEKAAAERKAAEAKAAAERMMEEKAAAERKAEEEKAAYEKKIAEEKAAAERKAAEKAEAERKAAEEKAAAERKAAEEEAKEQELGDISDENAEPEEMVDPEDFVELIGAENTDEKCKDECTDDDKGEGECRDNGAEYEKHDECSDNDNDLINTAQLAQTKNPSNTSQKETAPANFNQYINRHNNNVQRNCPNCQKKRAMTQK